MAEYKYINPDDITDDMLEEFLDKREQAAIKRKEYQKTHPGSHTNNWERIKAKMASDPKFAEEVKAKRKEYQEKRKAALEADPLKAAELKKSRTEYNKKRNTRMKELEKLARERGLITD